MGIIIISEVVLATLAALCAAIIVETDDSVAKTLLAAVGPLLIHDIDDKIYAMYNKFKSKPYVKLGYIIGFIILLFGIYGTAGVLNWDATK
mmetsp:Transcript_35389/g.43733  ORF Transcript_35389/g.43733 Transcript_35389/m.43733 type:complete len:91 (-) Transcript_35389:32-304(-)